MKAQEYQQVKNIIYNKYPTGIDYMMLGDSDTLWEELSGRITIPNDFDSENTIHHLNIQATQKHLSHYKTEITKLYQLLNGIRDKKHSKVYMKKLNNQIYNLSTLINDCNNNITMSGYFIDERAVEDAHLMKRNISS